MNDSLKEAQSRFRFGRTLALLWGSWILLFIAKAFLNQVVPDTDAQNLALLFVAIHSILVTLILLLSGTSRISFVLVGAFFVRLMWLLVDRFVPIEVPFLSDTGDARGYFNAGVLISQDLSLAGDTYGGSYSAILGYMFNLVGPDRLFGQYFNVICGITTLLLLVATLNLLKISNSTIFIVLLLGSFLPLVSLHSSVLLRESIIQMLVSLSTYFFIRGVVQGKFLWTIFSMISVLLASMFHSGVIGVLFGFALASTFTYLKDGKFQFGIKNIFPAALMGVFGIGVLLRNPALFLGKFQHLQSADDLLNTGLTGRGDAAYLTNIVVNDWPSFFLYSPIRAFYFVVSPVPWDWRGIGDLVAFALDSSLYLVVLVLLLKHRPLDYNQQYLVRMLSLVLLITCLIFGVGVSNSGQAIRHRVKIVVIVLVLLALLLESMKKRLLVEQETKISDANSKSEKGKTKHKSNSQTKNGERADSYGIERIDIQ